MHTPPSPRACMNKLQSGQRRTPTKRSPQLVHSYTVCARRSVMVRCESGAVLAVSCMTSSVEKGDSSWTNPTSVLVKQGESSRSAERSGMQKAIEESARRGGVAQHLAPVFHRTIGGDQNRSGLIPAGEDLQQVLGC